MLRRLFWFILSLWASLSFGQDTITNQKPFSSNILSIKNPSNSISFSEVTNVLTNASQANCALNSSTGAITTTDFGGSSTTPTTYTFTLRLTDAEGQTANREFSLTSNFGSTGGGQFN